MTANLSPMRVVNSRIPQGATPRAVQRLSSWPGGVPGATADENETCAARDHGPNLSISVSPGAEIKGDSPSSGERKGSSQA